MSIPYAETGRTQQKLRTRNALTEAARDLIGRGITPTVEEAAAEASISRTTAYRYFPNQRELLVAAFPQIGEASMLPETASDDPVERLELVLDKLLRMTVDNEAALRTALRLSLEAEDGEELVLRRGRAIGWIEDALAPLRGQMSRREISRLALAIRSAAGLEALVWLCDVGGLSRTEAVRLMKWSAKAILRSAIAGERKGRSRH